MSETPQDLPLQPDQGPVLGTGAKGDPQHPEEMSAPVLSTPEVVEEPATPATDPATDPGASQ